MISAQYTRSSSSLRRDAVAKAFESRDVRTEKFIDEDAETQTVFSNCSKHDLHVRLTENVCLH